MAQRKGLPAGDPTGVNSDADARRSKVVVDFNVLASLALHAPVDIVESHYRQTRKAMKRLKLQGGDTLKQIDQVGTYPNVLDTMRWLDGIDKNLRSYREDRNFLKQFHATLESRLPPSTIKKIAEEEMA